MYVLTCTREKKNHVVKYVLTYTRAISYNPYLCIYNHIPMHICVYVCIGVNIYIHICIRMWICICM